MLALKLLLLAPLALATDNGQAVYDSITGINTAVLALSKALTAYNGGILESKPTFDASVNIHNVNRQGFALATASSNFTEAESKRIVQHTSNSVGVSIPASVTLLESKKPLFDAAEVSSIVEATILLLKTDHETFSAAVGSKLTPDQVAPGLLAAGKIDASLEGAAAYYAV